jgi:cytochrome c biogenesis protein CcmG, thiol:disulfide interchange protein DsbE
MRAGDITAMKKNSGHRSLYGSLAVLAVLAALFLYPATGRAAGPAALKIGDPPPRFVLQDLDGRTVTVPDDLKGKAVIIHFWADWCQYCVDEMPAIDGLYRQYRDKGLSVYAVNVSQTADVAKTFVKRVKVSYPILLDTDGKTAKQYSVLGLPRTFFLDRKGRIKYKLLGEASEETLRKLILNML